MAENNQQRVNHFVNPLAAPIPFPQTTQSIITAQVFSFWNPNTPSCTHAREALKLCLNNQDCSVKDTVRLFIEKLEKCSKND